MQHRRIGAGLELLAQRTVTEQFGNFRQDFKMLLRGGLRHQQKNQQIDGLLVGRIRSELRSRTPAARSRVWSVLDAQLLVLAGKATGVRTGVRGALR